MKLSLVCFNPLPSSLHCRKLYVNGVHFNFLMAGAISCSPECTWHVKHVDMSEPWSFRTVKQLFIGSWSFLAVKHCLQGSEVKKQKYRLGREFCSSTLWDSKSLGRRQFLWASNFCEQVRHRYDKNILICFPFFFLFFHFPFLLLLWLLFLELHFLLLHTYYSLVYFPPFSTFSLLIRISFTLFFFSSFFCSFSFTVCSLAFRLSLSFFCSVFLFYLPYRQQIF